MHKTFGSLALLLVLAFLAGCGRPSATPLPPGPFAIYLLARDVPLARLAAVDLRSLPLREPPVLTGDEIIAYDAASHDIELVPEAYRRVQQLFRLPVKVDGLPFVVCVGREPIYAGAFWTPLSSLSFDGVTIMQPLAPEGLSIQLELGYPGPAAFLGPDPRSDPRVMAALEYAGKLK